MLGEVRTALTGRLASVRSDIASLEAAMTGAATGGIGSMELDTGEGRQKVVFKNVESVQRALTKLYAMEEWLIRRLNGGTLISIRKRRKS